jgi:hypothetical protein
MVLALRRRNTFRPMKRAKNEGRADHMMLNLFFFFFFLCSPSGQVQSGKFETIFSFSRALFEV